MITVVITRRASDYHARVDPGVQWDRGLSVQEAVGNLVLTHPDAFHVRIEHDGTLPRGEVSTDLDSVQAGWVALATQHCGLRDGQLHLASPTGLTMTLFEPMGSRRAQLIMQIVRDIAACGVSAASQNVPAYADATGGRVLVHRLVEDDQVEPSSFCDVVFADGLLRGRTVSVEIDRKTAEHLRDQLTRELSR